MEWTGQYKSLNPGIVRAVSDLIAESTGKINACPDFSCPEEITAVPADPSQLAVALAYAHLCIDEPEMVTSRHLKMLRRNFSYEQIQELNSLIRKMIE